MASAVANTAPNTIVVSEKRDVINEFKDWYKVKIIDTGVSQKFEEGLVKYHRVQEKACVILGQVATIILTVYPGDGNLGETISIVASPLFQKLVTWKNKATEMNVINAKRTFEAHFIKADGSSEKVSVPKIDLEELDVKKIASEVKDIMKQIEDLDKQTSNKTKDTMTETNDLDTQVLKGARR